MTYELHPLCTLFPRLSGAEFGALRAFSGIRQDRLAIADFHVAEDQPGHWNFAIFDVPAKQHVKANRPIAGDGVALLLDEYGGRASWLLTPASAKAQQVEREREVVYFLQAGPFIKIGKATGRATNRVAQLQTGCPFPITILALIDGGRAVEARLHRRFASYRAHGEWFHAAPELTAYVQRVAASELSQ